MSKATKFERHWDAQKRYPADYAELAAAVYAIDRKADIRAKDEPPALLITFSDGSTVKIVEENSKLH